MNQKKFPVIAIVIAVVLVLFFIGANRDKTPDTGYKENPQTVSTTTVKKPDTVTSGTEITPSVTLPVPAETDNTSDSTTVPDSTSDSNTATTITTTTEATTTTAVVTEPEKVELSDLIVHFIDVGQGDSIFIELPNGEAMLIDAGESSEGDKVATYVFSQGYNTIDYVVASHPHSDHIGGLADVINTFNIRNFYLNAVETDSDAYDNMMRSVNNSGVYAYNVTAGDVILNIENLLIEVVAPKTTDYEEMNNNSVVIKLTYGNNRFLFTGDAEKSEEDGIWTNIKCDVLKVGHHGSDSSSSANFLKKVEPTYAVISCGLYNSYGHPTDKVLERLYERNINVYRTDLQGTIVFTSDGENISVNVNPSEYAPPVTTTTTVQTNAPPPADNSVTYVLNTNTKKIHYMSCSSVDSMKEHNKAFTTDYNKAIAEGYKPCKRCNP